MQNTKLLHYLSKLRKKEVKLFNDFIQSPYHNKSELIQELWTYLKPFVPRLNTSKIERDVIIEHLYQEVNLNNNKKFNDLTVAFCKLFEQFIILQNLEKNTNYTTRLLVDAFGERRLSKYFYRLIERSKRVIQKKKVKDINDYEQLLFLESERTFYPETSKYDAGDDGMQVILDTIYDYAALLSLTKIAAAKQTEMFINREYNYSKLKEFTKTQSENKLVQLYQLIITLASEKEQNWKVINELMALFKTTKSTIKNRRERLDILNFLINYASIHYSNDLRYYELLFQNLKLGMETKLLIEKKYLHEGHFINTCIVACELGYANWLETFIQNFIVYIDDEKQEMINEIALANLFFAQKEYNAVLNHISSVNVKKSIFEYWYRTIELRAFFELLMQDDTYLDLVENKMEAFRRDCYRKKDMSKTKMEAHLHFLNHIKALIGWKTYSKKKQDAEKDRIIKEATICKLWLLKTMQEL